ncbi:hypothetical protein BJX62DRAFT_219092 [Aspergillus germanicus]
MNNSTHIVVLTLLKILSTHMTGGSIPYVHQSGGFKDRDRIRIMENGIYFLKGVGCYLVRLLLRTRRSSVVV